METELLNPVADLVLFEQLHRLGGQTADFLPELTVVAVDLVGGEQRHVAAPLALGGAGR